MKINYGCGSHLIPGYFNIDAIAHNGKQPDLLHALSFSYDGSVINPTPLEDGCADELLALHVIEHVYAWEAPHLLAEWKRLLKPGGRLILELPNLRLACENFLAGLPDQMGMWPIYGDASHKDPYMMHKNGYTPETISALLYAAGFAYVTPLPPQTHGARLNRDMRVECVK
jgi:predicted SAM-dependent methyltransferase